MKVGSMMNNLHLLIRYELAEECADHDDAKAAILELTEDVLEELKMHNSFLQVSLNYLM